tara:strand:- start:2604 stop:2969 length:366 start_codon:yes stop_codon:yes gene_type:complete
MIGRALDSNNDLLIKAGNFQIVEDGEEVVQHVRTRLQFYLEEWFLDLKSGTPYFQQIFTKPINLANIESIFKSKILNTPEVDRLIEFSMSYEGESKRKLTVSFSAETIFGTIDNEKVTINV